MFSGLPGGRPLFSWFQTGKNGKNQDVKSVKITIREKRKKQETGNLSEHLQKSSACRCSDISGETRKVMRGTR